MEAVNRNLAVTNQLVAAVAGGGGAAFAGMKPGGHFYNPQIPNGTAGGNLLDINRLHYDQRRDNNAGGAVGIKAEVERAEAEKKQKLQQGLLNQQQS